MIEKAFSPDGFKYTGKDYATLDAATRKLGNVLIFNATRGGELEAFERVDFDSLF